MTVWCRRRGDSSTRESLRPDWREDRRESSIIIPIPPHILECTRYRWLPIVGGQLYHTFQILPTVVGTRYRWRPTRWSSEYGVMSGNRKSKEEFSFDEMEEIFSKIVKGSWCFRKRREKYQQGEAKRMLSASGKMKMIGSEETPPEYRDALYRRPESLKSENQHSDIGQKVGIISMDYRAKNKTYTRLPVLHRQEAVINDGSIRFSRGF